MAETVALILAAGEGTRMCSELAKVLHPVCGQPMVAHVAAAARAAGAQRLVVVVGHQADQVRAALGDGGIAYAVQRERRGTGHAVLAARELVPAGARLLVLYGDTPLVSGELLRRLLERHAAGRSAVTLFSAELEDPTGYGRILRDERGRVTGIVEDADCSADQARLREVNTGIGCFRAGELFAALAEVRPDNAKHEIYLTDAIGLLCATAAGGEALPVQDVEAVLGVNDRRAMARAEAVMRGRILDRLFLAGVTIVDPSAVYVDARVEIGADTTLLPGTVLEGPCRVGRGCRLGPGAHLRATLLGDRVTVSHSVVEESEVGDDAQIGPFSHLRPHTRLEPGVQVGNFAELKNSRLGRRAKVHHHSYLGDADVGEAVNIGAGTVTVNYDGEAKHRTRIGPRAFIGCNANLIAPLEVGDDAYVAAGSTLTDDVPPGALAIGRSRQVVKPEWVWRRFPGRRAGQTAPNGEGAGGRNTEITDETSGG